MADPGLGIRPSSLGLAGHRSFGPLLADIFAGRMVSTKDARQSSEGYPTKVD